MLKYIVTSPNSALVHLMMVLSQCSREETCCAFSGVIRLWLDYTRMQIQLQKDADSRRWDFSHHALPFAAIGEPTPALSSQSLYHREKDNLGQHTVGTDKALHNILEFVTRAGEQHTALRLGMIDAGSLALVLSAFANVNFGLSSLICTPEMEGKTNNSKSERWPDIDSGVTRLSSTAINAEASTLSVAIYSPKFVERWGAERFATRLSLCSSLVDSLLRQEGVVDDEYEVTRALFRKIVDSNP
jgi:hypothetical protein